jgi:hypothetical protein
MNITRIRSSLLYAHILALCCSLFSTSAIAADSDYSRWKVNISGVYSIYPIYGSIPIKTGSYKTNFDVNVKTDQENSGDGGFSIINSAHISSLIPIYYDNKLFLQNIEFSGLSTRAFSPQYNWDYRLSEIQLFHSFQPINDMLIPLAKSYCAGIIYGGQPLDCEKIDESRVGEVFIEGVQHQFSDTTNINRDLPFYSDFFDVIYEQNTWPYSFSSLDNNIWYSQWNAFATQESDPSTSYQVGFRSEYQINNFTISSVPESSFWIQMILGFFIAGTVARNKLKIPHEKQVIS